MRHFKRGWTGWAGIVLALTIGGCGDAPVQPDDTPAPLLSEAGDHVESARAHEGSDEVAVRQWMRRLRQATDAYRRLDAAIAAGYDASLTPCMESTAGGMGFHYGNLSLFDDQVEELEPEILVYEPLPSGGVRLVAVEYVVPFAAWTAADPPSLNGVSFHANDVFGLWVLHAWAWMVNPAGTLEDWNPRVSCGSAG